VGFLITEDLLVKVGIAVGGEPTELTRRQHIAVRLFDTRLRE
jgi:hypothetical protein